MSRHSPRRRRAFTLIEVAVASLVGAMLILVLGSMVRMATKSFGATNEKLDALQAATMISEIIHRDLRYMVIPVLAAPTKTNAELVATGNQNNQDGANTTPPAGTDPNALDPNSGNLPPPPDEQVTELKRETLLPFLEPHDTEARPAANPAVVYDMTLEPDKPFVFFKNKAQVQGGGLLGGSSTAAFDLQRVTYEVVASNRFKDPQLFGLKRTVHNVRVDVDSATREERVTEEGQVSERFFKSYYFRRLVLSLHETPEAGIATGAAPTATVAPPPASAPGNGAPPVLAPTMDVLYFVRIMIAGASAGPGSRQVKTEGEEAAAANVQTLDLLVNLIHLDGVTERFRSRSLATRWNSELPLSDPTP